MFRFIFVLTLASLFSTVSYAQEGVTVGYFDPNSGRLMIEETFKERVSLEMFDQLRAGGPGATLIMFNDGGHSIRIPLPGSRTMASKQADAVLLTDRQSQALAFRGEAVATYADREADQSAQNWYRLEQDSRITDARIRQMDVDSSNRLRQQELREQESRRRAYEQSARRREEVRRNREAEELREHQQAQRERDQAFDNARAAARDLAITLERAKAARKK